MSSYGQRRASTVDDAKNARAPAASGACLPHEVRPRRPQFERLISIAASGGATAAAVVYPCSATSLESVVMALHAGLIEPTLIGPRARIELIAQSADLDLGGCRFLDTGDDPLAAARQATALCSNHGASLIIKGSLHTDELLSVVVGADGGLRTTRRASHVFLMDIPGVDRPIFMADCVVNILPTLLEKRDITQSTVDVAHAFGIVRPYVAVLSAVETVNPAIQATVDAAALSKMAERGQITGADVEGPLSYDVAMSPEAARIKEVLIKDGRQPDVLIMPNMEAGNMLYKQWVHSFGAACAGLIVGTRVPVVCNSRSELPENRVASCALAALQHRRPFG